MRSEQRQRERSLYIRRKDEDIYSLMEENMCDQVCDIYPVITCVRGPRGPVFAEDLALHSSEVATRIETYSCYVCGMGMQLKGAHNRMFHGRIMTVPAHFSHVHAGVTTARPRCNKTDNVHEREAAKHWMAHILQSSTIAENDVLVENNVVCQDDCSFTVASMFYFSCVSCRARVEITLPKGRCVLDYTVEHTTKTNPLCLDVAILDPTTNKLIGAMEVCQTDVMSLEKREYLTMAGIAWVEIHANNILHPITNVARGYLILGSASMTCATCSLADQGSKKSIQEWQPTPDWPNVMCQHFTIPIPSQLDMERDNVNKEASERQANTLGHRPWTHLSQEQKSNILHAGKYKNHCLVSVWSVDKKYVRWVAGYTGWLNERKRPKCISSSVSNRRWLSPELVLKARQLVKGHCLICFAPIVVEWYTHCSCCFKMAMECV